ncbi:hypothetical protein JW960_26645 [candidate division KSB1 bacterium]|nr:hypothetical protein [candidate division KSB1 bacterium]
MKRLLLFSIVILLTHCAAMNSSRSPADAQFKKQLEQFQLNQKIPVSELTEDIDFAISTIEEVHPNAYFAIDKDLFYQKADSVKAALFPMTRLEFAFVLKPLLSRQRASA